MAINHFMSNDATCTTRTYVTPRPNYCNFNQLVINCTNWLTLQQDVANEPESRKTVPSQNVLYVTMLCRQWTSLDYHTSTIVMSSIWAVTEVPWATYKLENCAITLILRIPPRNSSLDACSEILATNFLKSSDWAAIELLRQAACRGTAMLCNPSQYAQLWSTFMLLSSL